MLKNAISEEEVVDLLGRYPNVAPNEWQSIKSWLRRATHVQFVRLLSHGPAFANLTRARNLDADLRQTLRAQAARQLHYAGGVLLIITILSLAVAR
jgi:hypothetical protein